MRRLISLAVVVGLIAAMAPSALATPGDTTTCQRGADNERVGPWEEWTTEDVEAFLRELAADRPWITEEMIQARLAEIMAFNDHNGDGKLCVMVLYFPNDASGAETVWTLLDNHHDPRQSRS